MTFIIAEHMRTLNLLHYGFEVALTHQNMLYCNSKSENEKAVGIHQEISIKWETKGKRHGLHLNIHKG